jgi:hypothetical protein
MEIMYGSSKNFPKIPGCDSQETSRSPEAIARAKSSDGIYGNRIEMIPLRKISEMKGFLKGIDTTVEREPDRL